MAVSRRIEYRSCSHAKKSSARLIFLWTMFTSTSGWRVWLVVRRPCRIGNVYGSKIQRINGSIISYFNEGSAVASFLWRLGDVNVQFATFAERIQAQCVNRVLKIVRNYCKTSGRTIKQQNWTYLKETAIYAVQLVFQEFLGTEKIQFSAASNGKDEVEARQTVLSRLRGQSWK